MPTKRPPSPPLLGLLAVALGACAGPPEAPQGAPAVAEPAARAAVVESAARAAVVEPAAAVAAPICPLASVVSLEPNNGRACQAKAQGEGGAWVGEPLVALTGGVFCRYAWKPAPAFAAVGPAPGQLSPVGGGRAPAAGLGQTVSPAGLAALPPGAQLAIAAAPPDGVALGRLGLKTESYEIDCPVVSAAGAPAPLDPADWKPLAESLLAQAGAAPAGRPPAGRVRVAMIDSAARPYASPLAETNGHARMLGRLVADLACPGGTAGCATEIRNYLALPWVTASLRDDDNGGNFGSRGDLVLAIARALDDWAADVQRRQMADLRLVLNLSLGWDPALDDRVPSRLTALAVRAVLLRASCMGALTFAAAGNGRGERGAFFPAAWEALPAPTAQECASLGFPRVPIVKLEPGKSGYTPLVHAVGAVDAGDRPLMTNRTGSQPRLVAHGLAAVLADPVRSPGHTAVLSGTSVAAAIASGAAAALWAAAPELPPADLVDLVHGKAAPLPGLAIELCRGGAACVGEVRRISVCGALQAVGADAGCAVLPAQSGAAPVCTAPAPGASVGADPCNPWGCTPAPGEAEQRPWVVPQPGKPVCPDCLLRWSGLLEATPEAELISAHGANWMRVSTSAGQTFDIAQPWDYALGERPRLPYSFWADLKPLGFVTPDAATVSFARDLGAFMVFLTEEQSIPVGP